MLWSLLGYGAKAAKAYPRPAIAAGYVGAGLGISTVMGEVAEHERAYMGDQAFESRYGGAFDTMRNISIIGGIGLGLGSFMGMGPIGLANRGRNTIGYGMATKQARSAKWAYRGARRQSQKVARDTASVPTANTTALVPYQASPSWYTPSMQGEAFVSQVNKIRSVAQANEGGALLNYHQAMARVSHFQGSPRFGKGTAILAGMVGIGSMAGAADPSTIGIGLGAAAGLSAIGFARKHPVGASIMAVGAAGGYASARVPMFAAAEGRITSFQEGPSPTRRMNFSTAGLVQALHHNRKM